MIETFRVAQCGGLIKAPPDVQFCLTKLLQNFKLDEVVRTKVKGLAQLFGVSDNLIAKSFRIFITEGVLTKEVHYEGKGRPCNTYCFTAQFKVLVRKRNLNNKLSGQAMVIADELLNSELCGNYRQNKRHNLDIKLRFLLIALYSLADDGGVISKLSLLSLQEKLAEHETRIKSSLGNLRKKGYIHQLQWGMEESLLFGSVASTIYLNIGKFKPTHQYLLTNKKVLTVDIAKYYFLASDICNKPAFSPPKKVADDLLLDEFKGLICASIFSNQNSREECVYWRSRLYHYAQDALNTCQSQSELDDDYISKIRGEFNFNSDNKLGYYLACISACIVKRLVNDIGADIDKMRTHLPHKISVTLVPSNSFKRTCGVYVVLHGAKLTEYEIKSIKRNNDAIRVEFR